MNSCLSCRVNLHDNDNEKINACQRLQQNISMVQLGSSTKVSPLRVFYAGKFS